MKGKIGFQKGNKLGGSDYNRHPKVQAWENLGAKFVTDFSLRAWEIIRDLAEGKKITPQDKMFLEEYKDLLEFFKPKLQRRDGTMTSTVVHEFEEKQAIEILKLHGESTE